jgi:hypothetical protein
MGSWRRTYTPRPELWRLVWQPLCEQAEALVTTISDLMGHKVPNPSTIGAAADRSRLRVVIERADWSNFRHEALILEMRVSVTNRTDTRKQLTGFQLYLAGQVTKEFDDPEVWRKVEHCKQQHNLLNRISVLEPGETVTGWMVYALPGRRPPASLSTRSA